MNLHIYLRSLWDELIPWAFIPFGKCCQFYGSVNSLSSRPFSFPQSSPSFYLFSYHFLPSSIPTFSSPLPLFHAYSVPNTTVNTWNTVLDNLEADLTCIPNQIPITLALFLCPGTCSIGQGGFVEIEGGNYFKENQYVLSYQEVEMNESYRQPT